MADEPHPAPAPIFEIPYLRLFPWLRLFQIPNAAANPNRVASSMPTRAKIFSPSLLRRNDPRRNHGRTRSWPPGDAALCSEGDTGAGEGDAGDK